jgi:hypothetical protein
MKKIAQVFSISLLGLIGSGILESAALGQDIAPFKGRGMKQKPAAAPDWFGSSREQQPLENSNGWFGQGIMRPARPSEMEDRPRILGSLFQRPETSEPSLIQRASDRSREMWDRTREWAADRNEAFKSRASDAWNNLTGGFLRPMGGTNEQIAPESFKGPLRTSEKPDTNKSERF